MASGMALAAVRACRREKSSKTLNAIVDDPYTYADPESAIFDKSNQSL